MMRAENEASPRWLEDAREFARHEGRWKLLEILGTSREEDGVCR